jgi:hypothetical protein
LPETGHTSNEDHLATFKLEIDVAQDSLLVEAKRNVAKLDRGRFVEFLCQVFAHGVFPSGHEEFP